MLGDKSSYLLGGWKRSCGRIEAFCLYANLSSVMLFLQAIGATFAAMIGAGMLVRSISYENSPAAKHLAWMMHSGT